MNKEILVLLNEIGSQLEFDPSSIQLDFPQDSGHGEFTTNLAMVNAKKANMPPKALAEKIVAMFKEKMPDSVLSVEIAGPGFINFKIKDSVIAVEALRGPTSRGQISKGRVMIEYTDPNTFKVFHIGHLMSNAIGESLSRLIEYSGADMVRICYPSDIGLHIAKSLWALSKHKDDMPADDAPIALRTAFLGKMYVEGTGAYENNPADRDDIDALNKVIYEKSSPAINEMYTRGRSWSLAHFEQLYEILGTHFNEQIYESDMAPVGLSIVHDNMKKGIFEASEGATVFKGEKYGLHTRVFINSHGLPTYEAKDVGLNVTKFQKYPDAVESIIVTASEQNDYFKVLTKVISLVDEKNGTKTKHIGHGMLRFASGKMSSRTGNVITAKSLISEIKDMAKEKIAGRGFDESESEEISTMIAVGAIKYTILRSSVGSDIIFDSSASISFEGDSGPYLQYAVVRANSILKKAMEEGIQSDTNSNNDSKPVVVGDVERLLVRFPDIIARARKELAPQIVANYLITLAGAFNSFYAGQIIVDKKDPLSPYRVALTKSFRDTMEKGLWILGIKVPEKM